VLTPVDPVTVRERTRSSAACGSTTNVVKLFEGQAGYPGRRRCTRSNSAFDELVSGVVAVAGECSRICRLKKPRYNYRLSRKRGSVFFRADRLLIPSARCVGHLQLLTGDGVGDGLVVSGVSDGGLLPLWSGNLDQLSHSRVT
jgi:hypothetical protein